MHSLELSVKYETYNFLKSEIDKLNFKNSLYELIEYGYTDLLSDLININCNTNIYNDEVFRILKTHCSEKELQAIDVYKKSISIINLTDINEIYQIVYDLKIKYAEYDFNYGILKDFDEIYKSYSNSKEIIFNYSEFELISKAQSVAEKVINKYNSITSGNWEDLFDDFT